MAPICMPFLTAIRSAGSERLIAPSHQQNVTVSEFMTKAGLVPEETYVQLTPLRVPIQAVRLIHPLRDPETGKVRDVIINELTPTGVIRDKPTGRVTWNRVVPGLNIEIPWPRIFEDAERAEMEQTLPDNECDTLRIDVEEQTFVPTLLQPPMPAEIVDELRNRYSKFRTRHEPEYLAKKEAEEAEKVARRKATQTMRTPVQELNAKIRLERKERGQPVLTDRMLEKIGEVMARNSHRAPAVTDVPENLISMAIQKAEEAEAIRLVEEAEAEEIRRVEMAIAEKARAQAEKAKAKEEKAKAKAAKIAKGLGLPPSQPAPENTTPPPS